MCHVWAKVSSALAVLEVRTAVDRWIVNLSSCCLLVPVTALHCIVDAKRQTQTEAISQSRYLLNKVDISDWKEAAPLSWLVDPCCIRPFKKPGRSQTPLRLLIVYQR